MASGSFYSYPVATFGLYCEWSSTPNEAGNYSTVTLNTYLSYYSLTVSARDDGSTSINGSSSGFSTSSINDYPGKYVKKLINSRTTTVYHNTDGSKSCTLSASWRFSGTYSGVSIGWITASQVVTLDKINVNKSPNNPTSFTTAGRTIHESTIPFRWSGASDPDGDTITYGVFVNAWNDAGTQLAAGDGNKCIYWSTGTGFDYDISGFPRGTKFEFWLKCTDGKVTTNWIYPTDTGGWHYRNYAPTTPSYISPSSGIYEGSIPVSWGASTDANGQSITYELDVSKNGGSYSTIATGLTTNSYSYAIPAGDAEGTNYKFRVRTKDVLGAYSPDYATASGVCYKNKRPSIPGAVSPASGYFESPITVAWGASSDGDGHAITYTVEVQIDGGSWQQLATKVTGTSYSYNISTHTRPTQYRFRVKAVDSVGGESAYTTATNYCYKNRIPTAPVMTYPLTGKTIYSRRPRILFTIKADADNQKQSASVYWSGSWYNTISNPTLFSRSGDQLTAETKIVFLPPIDCPTGNIAVKIKTNDGLIDSAEQLYTLTVANDSMVPITAEVTPISKNLFDQMRTTINTVRAAYGLAAYSFTDPTLVSGTSTPKAVWITELRTAINDVVTIINNWDSGNTNRDISVTWSTITAGTTTTSFAIIDQIYDIIRGL